MVTDTYDGMTLEELYASMARLCDHVGGALGRHDRRIHRLVAEAFLGTQPDGRPEINHINGDKGDCRVANLEWVSRRENARHAARHGLMRHGERHPRARLSEETIRTVRALRAGGALHREIAAAVGVARSTISSLLGGRSWRHLEAQHAVHGD